MTWIQCFSYFHNIFSGTTTISLSCKSTMWVEDSAFLWVPVEIIPLEQNLTVSHWIPNEREQTWPKIRKSSLKKAYLQNITMWDLVQSVIMWSDSYSDWQKLKKDHKCGTQKINRLYYLSYTRRKDDGSTRILGTPTLVTMQKII